MSVCVGVSYYCKGLIAGELVWCWVNSVDWYFTFLNLIECVIKCCCWWWFWYGVAF